MIKDNIILFVIIISIFFKNNNVFIINILYCKYTQTDYIFYDNKIVIDLIYTY